MTLTMIPFTIRMTAGMALLLSGTWLGAQDAAKPLPDAPSAQREQQTAQPSRPSHAKLPAILAPQMTREPLTAADKFRLYTHQAFNPVALVPPIFTAAFLMANPPRGYPHEWRAGAEGYGRLYADGLVRRETQQAGTFLVGAALREDPRYLPSAGHGTLGRVTHALAFVVVDKSDAGHNMPAFSNFAGAAASGFVGMAYLPRGFDNVTHAGQRSALAMAGFAAGNLANEFCPQWGPLVAKLHLPFVHPPCEERIKKKP